MVARTNGLRRELRTFARNHRNGWNHDEWTGLVSLLNEEGHDVNDPDALGLALEQERVRLVLAELGVSGLGPKRRDALCTCYPRMWDLEQATVEELAALPSVPHSLAVNLYEALHG